MTYVHTSVERSAPLWEMAPDMAAAAVERHHERVDSSVRAHGGALVADDDSVLARFPSAGAAVSAALAIHRALAAEEWPEGIPIRVRIGIHTEEQYGAQLRDVANGGQTLLSAATASEVADALPEGVRLVDLGVHRLRDLWHAGRLFEVRDPDLPRDFPPVRSLDQLPNNLPSQLTSFVGRGDELVELERLLGEQRLVTISGAGGCGKSRLAVQAAAGLVERWPDGVWWVDLGVVTDPDRVVAATAAALRVRLDPTRDPLAGLVGQVRGYRLLICLDTCEHVLDACAKLVDALLRSCPDVRVLATSREPLGVAGETVWRVPSLVEAEAVRLFADRATLVRPDPDASLSDDERVRTICRHLDGIPLAIELAAAWIRALTPAQIVAGLDDRFRLLTGGPRTASSRQRTLAASMEWSHDLLTDLDRVVFRRLAGFAAAFTLEAARAVCTDGELVVESDVLAVLGRLVDKSLVTVSTSADAARYRLLDTVRQYAEQRLEAAGEEVATRDRHLDHFLALVEAAELDRDQDRWRQELDGQQDDIEAALRWGLSATDQERGRRLAAGMARHWFIRGRAHEGLELLRDAVDLEPDDRSGLQARLLAGVAMLGMISGRFDLIETSAERGLEIAAETGDDRSRARCLAMLAYRWFLFDFERCRALAEEAVAVAEAANEPFARDWARVIGAYTYTTRDRHDEAVALSRRAYELSLPRGDRLNAAFALGVEFWALMPTGELPRAIEGAEEAVRIAEPAGDYFGYGTIASNLAIGLGMAGRIDEARRLMAPIVRAVETTPDTDVVGLAGCVGLLHLWGGDLEGAVRWFERGVRFAEPDSDNWTVVRSLPGLASALRRLGRLDEARRHADRVVALTRAFDGPLWLAAGLDEQAYLAVDEDPRRAENLHHEALAVRVASGLRTFYADSLDALARLATLADSHAEAIRLLAAGDRGRVELSYPRPPVDRPGHDALVETLRAAVSESAFDAAWSEGSALTLDEAVGYATRARGTRDRPTHGWASLTPTERDVVRLVTEGLSNPEIAARLFVSRATVKTHLSHVYAKLEVANRTELTRLAGEHDG